MAKINLQGQEKQTTQLIQTFTISICIATIAFFNLHLSLAKLNSESQAKIYEIQRKANVAENRLEWTKEAAKLQAQNEITQAKIYEIERKANVAENRLAWTKEAAKLQAQNEIMRSIQATDKKNDFTSKEFQKEVTEGARKARQLF